MILFFDGDRTPASDEGIWIKSIREYAEKEELISVKIEENMDWNRVCRCLEDAHAIVLAADVYMDSVSSRVLDFLEKIEQAVIGGESIGAKFYAILHTDLYEGEQTGIAMAVLKNFCERANITWGRGLGIGGNNLKAALRRKRLWKKSDKDAADFRLCFLHEQALFIREKIQGTDVYIKPNEVSRGWYIRQNNRQIKKINRVKVTEY
ncbi:MAG: hypothetical protein K2N73_08900 [Lachnospiraceae bacterium]|nr:hypothetical protein [Lachnospiraceae bacterium]